MVSVCDRHGRRDGQTGGQRHLLLRRANLHYAASRQKLSTLSRLIQMQSQCSILHCDYLCVCVCVCVCESTCVKLTSPSTYEALWSATPSRASMLCLARVLATRLVNQSEASDSSAAAATSEQTTVSAVR